MRKHLSKAGLLRDLEDIAKKGKKQAERVGISEKDIPDIIERRRKQRRLTKS